MTYSLGHKSEISLLIQNDDFRKLQTRYKDYQQVYTGGSKGDSNVDSDRSKEDSNVDSNNISDSNCNMQRIPDGSSIFTAEAKSIDLALYLIRTRDINNKFIILSDSLSVLKAIN